jgi:hypothetical protein
MLARIDKARAHPSPGIPHDDVLINQRVWALKFIWEPAARADLRSPDKDTAMKILLALTRHGETGKVTSSD